MSDKFIITIDRQYASGGLMLAEALSKSINVPFYSREITEIAAEKSGIPKDYLESTEENVSQSFLYRLSIAAKAGSIDADSAVSKSEILYNELTKTVKEFADKESCIIVGNCADYILREYDNVFKIFLCASMDDKITRAVEAYSINKSNAEYIIRKNDKRRESFYNAYTSQTWGVKDNYHLCLNTSLIPIETCAEIIVNAVSYIR